MTRFCVAWIQFSICLIDVLGDALAKYLRKDGHDIILGSALRRPGVPAEILPLIFCEADDQFKFSQRILLFGQESSGKMRCEAAIDNRPDRAPGAILIWGEVALHDAMHSEQSVRIECREFISVGN